MHVGRFWLAITVAKSTTNFHSIIHLIDKIHNNRYLHDSRVNQLHTSIKKKTERSYRLCCILCKAVVWRNVLGERLQDCCLLSRFHFSNITKFMSIRGANKMNVWKRGAGFHTLCAKWVMCYCFFSVFQIKTDDCRWIIVAVQINSSHAWDCWWRDRCVMRTWMVSGRWVESSIYR